MHPLFHHLFVDYCAYFNGNQDYFECHEVLEEYWKEIAPGEKEHPLVGYIQIATGMYHWRRGNLRGAGRMLANGLQILSKVQNGYEQFGELIDLEQLLMDAQTAIEDVAARNSFTPFEVKIVDSELRAHVAAQIEELQPVSTDYLIDKHKLRDRSNVIAERLARLQSKKDCSQNN